MQIVRDGGKLSGDSRFSSTFTGPAVFDEKDKFQTMTFDKIEKGSKIQIDSVDNGWIAMIQHFFVSGIVPAGNVQREMYVKKIDTNLYGRRQSDSTRCDRSRCIEVD